MYDITHRRQERFVQKGPLHDAHSPTRYSSSKRPPPLARPPFCRCEEDSGELGNCLSFFGLFTIAICFISVAILCLTKPMSSSAHWHKVDLILFITVIDIYLAHSLLLKKNGNGKSRNKKNAEHITVLGEYLQIISHITVPCAQEDILGQLYKLRWPMSQDAVKFTRFWKSESKNIACCQKAGWWCHRRQAGHGKRTEDLEGGAWERHKAGEASNSEGNPLNMMVIIIQCEGHTKGTRKNDNYAMVHPLSYMSANSSPEESTLHRKINKTKKSTFLCCIMMFLDRRRLKAAE